MSYILKYIRERERGRPLIWESMAYIELGLFHVSGEILCLRSEIRVGYKSRVEERKPCADCYRALPERCAQLLAVDEDVDSAPLLVGGDGLGRLSQISGDALEGRVYGRRGGFRRGRSDELAEDELEALGEGGEAAGGVGGVGVGGGGGVADLRQGAVDRLHRRRRKGGGGGHLPAEGGGGNGRLFSIGGVLEPDALGCVDYSQVCILVFSLFFRLLYLGEDDENLCRHHAPFIKIDHLAQF